MRRSNFDRPGWFVSKDGGGGSREVEKEKGEWGCQGPECGSCIRGVHFASRLVHRSLIQISGSNF
ncbi:hypothetical protein CPB83DRAFT_856776 [Crepidotus variabilis]|uniref:Uncharacterized protein n=1 Tax=Crepidotus variabilis TaxID=179855 RepID=A0A9P6JNT1_9AGAR|nr:hypothetical protein CPB83DRAFT_856776 [Crepidotus variabilis]